MTLTVTQGFDYRMLTYISPAYPCHGEDVTYSNFQMWQHSVEDAPPASRVKPDAPLWLHPTAQNLQYTTHLVYGIYKNGPKYYSTWWCNGTPIKRYRTIWNGVSPGSKEWYDNDTNWNLDMRLKIKDTAVNLGTSLVEYRETAHMFYTFAKGVHDAWRLAHGRLPRRRRHLTPCDVAASWLGYSYGVAPLASDLFDSALALQGRLADPIYRRFITTSKNSGRVNTNDKIGGWKVSDRCIAYVRLDPNRTDFVLGNPLENAWEGIPFSFVVDWGIGVGDWLSSLDALKDVVGMTGTLTHKERYYHQYRPSLPAESEWVTPVPSYKYLSHKRSVVTTIPTPIIPRWDPSRSWKTIMNGLALLGVLNKRCQSIPSYKLYKRQYRGF